MIDFSNTEGDQTSQLNLDREVSVDTELSLPTLGQSQQNKAVGHIACSITVAPCSYSASPLKPQPNPLEKKSLSWLD